VAGLAMFIVPTPPSASAVIGGTPQKSIGLLEIYSDQRFWRLAPASALIMGSAWAMHGLWAASWLRNVAHQDQSEIVGTLAIMAVAMCAGALSFGVIGNHLRRRDISSDLLLAAIALLTVLSETALALRWPVPPLVSWSIIGAAAAGTAISYSITPELFPKESVARANSALNLLHFGTAFSVQCGIGYIVNSWSLDGSGFYPSIAFTTAFLAIAVLQLMSVLWLLGGQRVVKVSTVTIPSPATAENWLHGCFRVATVCTFAALIGGAVVDQGPAGLGYIAAKAGLTPSLPSDDRVNLTMLRLEATVASVESTAIQLTQLGIAREHELSQLKAQIVLFQERINKLELREKGRVPPPPPPRSRTTAR
jgi:hypothetical protein